MSNFLGDVFLPTESSAILSSSELIAREGVNLQKGMTYRDKDALPVFLVLPHDGVYTDEWRADTNTYVFRGHDSVTAGAGREQDQVTMYENGRLSDNGKFLKAARTYADGAYKVPLQIHIYEKLDAGIWFDKGIFDLVDAAEVSKEGRRVYEFYLRPSAIVAEGRHVRERMLPAAAKKDAWAAASGRCQECGTQIGLRFMPGAEVRLLCPTHRGEGGGLLG